MFDGNGNWTSDFSAQADRDNGIKILASRFDNIFIADIKESFENCLTKDGQIAPIGNFNMGGQKITNLNNGVNDNDAVNMSQFNNAVHKTGNEIITGSKTFTGTLGIPSDNLITKQDNAMEGGQINLEKPTNSSLTGNANIDIYGNRMRFLGRNSSNNYTTPLYLDLETNIAYATASDAVNSVVTTTGISKSPNGFVKFGNGLIIQWGYSTVDGSQVTLPTPFTSTNYRICATYMRASGSAGSGVGHVVTYPTNPTSFYANTEGGEYQWIAIGY